MYVTDNTVSFIGQQYPFDTNLNIRYTMLTLYFIFRNSSWLRKPSVFGIRGIPRGSPEPPSELVQSILLNVDALAGIAKPARASVSISIDTLMNAEARAAFAPKCPTDLLEACS